MTGRSHPVFRGSVKGLYFNETTCSFFRYFAKSDAILAEQSRKVFRDHVKGTELNTIIVPLFRDRVLKSTKQRSNFSAVPLRPYKTAR